MILSVSRRTDIPNHYSDWFFHRLREGFACVRNPANPRQVSRISLSPDVVDCVVFWSKNPEPMLTRLSELNRYPYYVQFTLNGYGSEIEPGLPNKQRLVDTFQRLSKTIGPDRVVWRYDPILLSPRYTPDYHASAFQEMAEQLRGYTKTAVVSFLDLYPKIERSLEQRKIRVPEQNEVERLVAAISRIAEKNGMKVQACAERADLRPYGIARGSCIDRRLIETLLGAPLAAKKDKNQRKECGCLESIDIGSYNTCLNGCLYCYASSSPNAAADGVRRYDPLSPLLCDTLADTDLLVPRKVKSFQTDQLSFF